MEENEKTVEKKKRPTAHEAAIELLEKSPEIYFDTLYSMYMMGVVVPREAIRGLQRAFINAGVKLGGQRSSMLGIVRVLQEQLDEEADEKDGGEEVKIAHVVEFDEGGR